ncbi:helix-turn-helix domain-containing protein [Sphingomonas sp. MAH-20]|uniref:Helix-turn-helix domain-containing protein n=1 Tax=Sphingomonas horti TaxID=2682842 RepID=A0A6I4IZI0_9SPHN|nr:MULTISPECIES: Crp/Fnr family transcriptional regulator [Sphingomonas]MBA2918291.1 Crp/Fnr family transcriptional regulator [Sphingomonas sp. CGMCC 1.13658]MVO77258.1 helix-turn-helix domain-containing protein [Sphingomonas horti]
MAGPTQTDVQNWLLRALPPESYALIGPHLRAVETPKGMTVFEPDQPLRFGYFFEGGMGSVIAEAESGQAVEIGLYGVDGFAGIPLILRSHRSPHRLDMQIGGSAWAVPAAEFEALLDTSPPLLTTMLRYVQFFLLQSGETCLYNAMRPIEERLARWLLMSHDRLPGDDVPLTHDYLAIMLGSSRTTVTFALGNLGERGVIRTARGTIGILDRAMLERIAGDGYGLPEREYNRLIAQRLGNAAQSMSVH